MPRWIWPISEYNLTTRDSPKRTLKSGPFVRERRGSGPEKQQPKHNPCRPAGSKAPGHRVYGKGPYDRLESKGYPNTINGKYEVA